MGECSFTDRRQLPCGDQTPKAIRHFTGNVKIGDDVAIRHITEDCRITYSLSKVDGVTAKGMLAIREHGLFDGLGKPQGNDAPRLAVVQPSYKVVRAITNKNRYALNLKPKQNLSGQPPGEAA